MNNEILPCRKSSYSSMEIEAYKEVWDPNKRDIKCKCKLVKCSRGFSLFRCHDSHQNLFCRSSFWSCVLVIERSDNFTLL